MARTAEVSTPNHLACATNCEACTSGAVTGCSRCYAGYYAHPTTQACESSCPDSYYADAASRSCLQCDVACGDCNGAGHTSCLTCSAQYYSSAANTCSPCDPLCDGCYGPNNSECSACASGKYSLDGTALTCLNACTDVGSTYYLDGTVCKACVAPCLTCEGPQHYECNTCDGSSIEYVDSSLKNPLHCKTDCGVETYVDGSVCRDCASNCLTCGGGAVADCTQCVTGFFVFLSTNQCLNPCPDSYFGDAGSGNCEPCANSCSTCVTSATNCLSCAS